MTDRRLWEARENPWPMSSYWNPTPSTFTLTGASITSVTFEENNGNFAGNWVTFDNLVLDEASGPPVENTPEPSTYALLLCGLGLLAFWQRRKLNA